MRFVYSLRRTRYFAVTLALLCATLVGGSLLRSAAFQKNGPSAPTLSPAEMKQVFHQQIRKGIGSNVQFATSSASADEINASVESIGKFIEDRSDLGMSAQTKKRLTVLEQNTLAGKSRRISEEDLTFVLAGALLERVAALSDREIELAAKTSNGQEITLRANGDFRLTPEQFSQQVTAFRDQARQGSKAIQEAVQTVIGEEVNDRVAVLGEAVPEQFGEAATAGVTPLQAVLIAYSAITDDNLAGSQDDLYKAMHLSPVEATGKQPNTLRPEKAYGPKGRLFASPANLVFNKRSMSHLLDGIEKGGKAK